MPILEYKCKSCDSITEKIVLKPIDEVKITVVECKDCGGMATLLDLPTRSSFRLKPGGVGGFYSPHQD